MRDSSEYTDKAHSHVPAYVAEIKADLAMLTRAQKDLEADIDRRLGRIETCIMRWGAAIAVAAIGLLGWLANEFLAGLKGM